MTSQHKRTDYGVMFAEIIEENIKKLLSSGWQRSLNPGAPFDFGENHLRKYIQSSLQNGTCTLPLHWPRLLVERHVIGDFKVPGVRFGAIDYLFTHLEDAESLELRGTIATCEVSGPTRARLLAGSTSNWYPKIVADVRKQFWRSRHADNSEHYLVLLITPRPGWDAHHDIVGVLDAICSEVQGAMLMEIAWRPMSEIKNLVLAVYRVLPAASRHRAMLPPG